MAGWESLTYQELQQVVAAVHQINAQIGQLPGKMAVIAKTFADIKQEGTAAVEGVEKQTDDFWKRVKEGFDQIEQHGVATADKVGKSFKDRFDEALKGLDVLLMKWEKGVGGFRNAFSGGLGNVFSSIPIIGQLISGAMIGAEFGAKVRAAGNNIAREFAQVGRVSQDVVGRMTGDARKYHLEWGRSLDELGAVTQAFAQFGVSGEQAMTHVRHPAKGFVQDVMGLSYALDTVTKSATGTFGKAIAESAAISGKPLKEVAEGFERITAETRGAGVNVQAFLGVIQQASSSMRVQRQDAVALGDAYNLIRQGLGTMLGAHGAQAAQLAGGGLTKLAGAIGGMGPAMLGYMGGKIFGRGGTEGGMPGDEIVDMFRGLKDGSTLDKVTRQFYAIGQSMGGTQKHQILGLGSNPEFGLGLEGAQAVYAYMTEAAKGAKADPALMKKFKAELSTAFASAQAGDSPFERWARQAVLAMSDIMRGVLNAVVGGLAFLAGMPQAIANALTPGKSISDWLDLGDVVEESLEKATAGTMELLKNAGLATSGAVLDPRLLRTFSADHYSVREGQRAADQSFAHQLDLSAASLAAWHAGGRPTKYDIHTARRKLEEAHKERASMSRAHNSSWYSHLYESSVSAGDEGALTQGDFERARGLWPKSNPKARYVVPLGGPGAMNDRVDRLEIILHRGSGDRVEKGIV